MSCLSPPRSSRPRIVWPEEAGIGAAPASLAKAALLTRRPRCDQESTIWAASNGPTQVEQLRGELADQLFDLPCELAFLDGQLLDAASDCAQGEQRSAELGVVAAVWTARREPAEQARSTERAELAAKWLGGGHE